MEIGVLQDNAELLKSHNVSLHEEAQTLSLQLTVCPATLLCYLARYSTSNSRTCDFRAKIFLLVPRPPRNEVSELIFLTIGSCLVCIIELGCQAQLKCKSCLR